MSQKLFAVQKKQAERIKLMLDGGCLMLDGLAPIQHPASRIKHQERAAWAAASFAIGTRNGEQLT